MFVAFMLEESVRQIAQKYLELPYDDPQRPDTGRPFWQEWSLGSIGGYAIFGFDHSVENGWGYDLFIQGNAFGSWEEPAIVWVSQDENGNGKPDDTWYELAGSARNDTLATMPRYAIKYYRFPHRPDNKRKEDNLGQITLSTSTSPGSFPYWVDCEEYVIYHATKTTVPPNSTGYVETLSRPAFKISDAVQADGASVHLDYIDFVKIQALSSSEFYTPEDLNIDNPEYLVEGLSVGNGDYTYEFTGGGGYPVTIAIGGQEYALPVTVTLQESTAYFEIINAGNCGFEKGPGKVTFYMY
jgi:hypothetical protein